MIGWYLKANTVYRLHWKNKVVSLYIRERTRFGEFPLRMEKAMAPHSNTLAWKIPWMEEPGRLSPWGRWGSDTTERLHFHFSLSCIGEGNGNPLQCSCLENPRDWEPGGLPSKGSHRVRHDWTDLVAAAAPKSGYLFTGEKVISVDEVGKLTPWFESRGQRGTGGAVLAGSMAMRESTNSCRAADAAAELSCSGLQLP